MPIAKGREALLDRCLLVNNDLGLLEKHYVWWSSGHVAKLVEETLAACRVPAIEVERTDSESLLLARWLGNVRKRLLALIHP